MFDFNYSRFLEDPNKREAFIQGAITMASVLGSPCPYSCSDLRQESWVVNKLSEYVGKLEDEARCSARALIRRFRYSSDGLLGMIFDRAHIGCDGSACTEDGLPLEDMSYHPIPNCPIEHYPLYFYYNASDNTEITAEEYRALGCGDMSLYRKVRYINLCDDEGNFAMRAREDDPAIMEELLRRSIMSDDIMANRRYVIEMGKDWKSNPNSIISRYRRAICDVLHHNYEFKREIDEFEEITPMIITKAKLGGIKTIGQYYLAFLESFLVFASPSRKLSYETERLLDNLAAAVDDDDLFAAMFLDKDIQSYIGLNRCRNLPGLEEANGEPVEINLNDLDVDEKAKLNIRKDYIRRKLIPDVMKKREQITNQDEEQTSEPSEDEPSTDSCN